MAIPKPNLSPIGMWLSPFIKLHKAMIIAPNIIIIRIKSDRLVITWDQYVY